MKYIYAGLIITMLSSCTTSVIMLGRLADNPRSRHTPLHDTPHKKITTSYDLGTADTDSNGSNGSIYTLDLSFFSASTPPIPFALHVIIEIDKGFFNHINSDLPMTLVIDGKRFDLPIIKDSLQASTDPVFTTPFAFQSASYELNYVVLTALKSARVIEYKIYDSYEGSKVAFAGKFSQENFKNLANHTLINSYGTSSNPIKDQK